MRKVSRAFEESSCFSFGRFINSFFFSPLQVFGQRYCATNGSSPLANVDTIFILAFAIIMLNTDLHSPNIKPEKKMRLEQFIKNLRGKKNNRV